MGHPNDPFLGHPPTGRSFCLAVTQRPWFFGSNDLHGVAGACWQGHRDRTISLVPDGSTLYTPRGIPAHYFFFGWAQGLGRGSHLPQRESTWLEWNRWQERRVIFTACLPSLIHCSAVPRLL